MNLDYLDSIIPKRWILFVYYWLPFLPTPSYFYFQSRSFIDQLKRSSSKNFPLEKLPDLLHILVQYASTIEEKEAAQKMIAEIFTHKTKTVRLEFLSRILKNFNPEDKNIEIINKVFLYIPDKFYLDYFNPLLKGKNCSHLNLKWCSYFKNKFSLKDRLALCLSLPNEKLIEYQATLSKLVIKECEEKFMFEFDLTLLNTSAIERLLNIVFARSSTTIFSKNLLQSFVNQLLKKARESKKDQEATINSYIRPLNIYSRNNFFKDFLAQWQDQENIDYFLSLCPADQWPTLIDHVIVSVFNAIDTEMNNNHLIEESSIEANPNLLLLAPLQKQTISFPINLFQFLAIQYLTKQAFNLNVLKKAFSETQGSIKDHQTFPPALQSAVVEKYISAIKVFLQDLLIQVPKENKRQDVHHIFKQFCSHENHDKFTKIITLILKKLPEDLHARYETDLNFLQQLLSQLYLIIEDPLVIKYKNELMIEQNKSQREYEERTQVSRELLLSIREGKQSRVAYQRMEELFGEKALVMQEKWKKNLGVHFFDAEDKEELELAKKEAEEMKKLNREYNDSYALSALSYGLSTSPSLASYLNY